MRRSLLTCCALALTCGLPATALRAGEIESALDRAAEWLVRQQNPDGGFGPYSGPGSRVENASDVGITGLVLTAFARHPQEYRAAEDSFVADAVEFLLSKQQDDGGFYDPRDPVLRNYRTCVVVMALSELDPELYSKPIQRAREYIEGLQLDESRDYRKDRNLSYGAFGYGDSKIQGDLSNSGMAAGALKAAGTSASHPLWRRLEVFVSRSQNLPETDPLLESAGIGTTGEGGFRYAPADTRGPVESVDGKRVFPGYGSMTYQGLKSLLYAGVDRDDPRVVAAYEWISRHFTVRENPGMATESDPEAGLQGLYYYYHTMAKALRAYGKPVVVDEDGTEHDWARELSAHLIEVQNEDGSWVNEADRWWESIPELCTAYATISLATCREELQAREASASDGSGAEGNRGEDPEAEAGAGDR